MAKGGFFLAPNLYVDPNGNLLLDRDNSDGMGINWEKIGTYFAPFVAAGAGWIAAKGGGQQPQQQYPVGQPSGLQVGASSQGLFGGIDTTTLLLIGGAVLLFMSMPPSKK